MCFFEKCKKNNTVKTVRPVIFVVDTSASMGEEQLRWVNAALKVVMEKFAAYNRDETNKQCIKIAVLAGSSKWKWVTRGLTDPVSREIPAGKGKAVLGNGLLELDRNLSAKGLFSGSSVFTNTVICFLSAGTPTDDYTDALRVLNRNYWYVGAKKAAVGIGKSASIHILKQLTGNPETVVCLPHGEQLEKTILELCERELRSAASINAGIQPARLIAPPPLANYSASMPAAFDSDRFPTGRLAHLLAERMDCDEKRMNCDEERMVRVASSPFGGGNISDTVAFCTRCGAQIRSGSKFCHMCGSPNQQAEQTKVEVSQVQFSAVIPSRFMKGEYAMIDIAAYEELYREIVDQVIANADGEVREVVGSSQMVKDHTKIKIRLTSPDLPLLDCEETQIWCGRYLLFNFPVEIPADYGKNQVLFIAAVYFNDVIATRLQLLAKCTTEREQQLQLIRKDILSAFVSYASQDRSRVATVIQGMKMVRPDLKIFFDVESLRSGEEWEKTLRREIEMRDVLYLCWSNHAKASEWVEKEWRYALEKKGLESIEPIPLVLPSECPPPEELKSKHFYDRALLYSLL